MNEKDLFENMCFLPCWNDPAEAETARENGVYNAIMPDGSSDRNKKDLTTLLAELEEIKNNIENIKAKQWHLAKLIKFHSAGLTAK